MSAKSLRTQEMVSDEWRRLTPTVSVAPSWPTMTSLDHCVRQHIILLFFDLHAYHISKRPPIMVSTTTRMHAWSQRKSSTDAELHPSRRLDSIPFPLCFLE